MMTAKRTREWSTLPGKALRSTERTRVQTPRHGHQKVPQRWNYEIKEPGEKYMVRGVWSLG